MKTYPNAHILTKTRSFEKNLPERTNFIHDIDLVLKIDEIVTKAILAFVVLVSPFVWIVWR